MSITPNGILFYEARAKPLNTVGGIQPGSYYQFYQTGTLTPATVYADGGLTTPLSQTPGTGGTTAASDGRLVPIYLDPSVIYRYQLYNSNNVLLEDIDPYVTYLNPTQTQIGNALYPKTSAEITAGVTIVQPWFPTMYPERYGANTTPGVTSMTAAFQAAINVGKKGGGTVWVGPGPYLLDTTGLDLTFPVGSQNCNFGIIGYGRYKAATNTQATSQTPSIILKHTDTAAFDATGNLGVHFENLSICSDNTTYPQICFLLARNTDGASRSDRIQNCYVIGPFHKTILYNYAAEDGQYVGNQFYNLASDTNTSVFDITTSNVRAITSHYTTIDTGVQSCLDHKIFGGEYGNLFTGVGTSADVFRFEGARQVKINGIWIDSAAKGGTSGGRSLFYVDGSAGNPTQGLFLTDIDGEAAPFPPNYGIFVTNNAVTYADWTLNGVWMPTAVSMLGGGTGATIVNLNWINSVSASAGPGIIFNGAFQSCSFDGTAGTISAGSFDNFSNPFTPTMVIQNQGAAGLNIRDSSQSSGSQWYVIKNSGAQLQFGFCSDTGNPTAFPLILTHSGLGFNNASPIAKPTVTGSKGANAALTSLMTALANYGLVVDSTT